MNKKLLLGIAVLAIGLGVLPQTLALFSNQHNFYDTINNPTGAVPCLKCHSDIFTEISQPGAVNSAHAALASSSPGGCDACHATVAPAKEGISRGAPGPGVTFHAAAAPMCIDCHGPTGPGANAMNIVNGPNEVHTTFYNESTKSGFLRGGNEACIGCHTHVGVNITWQRATTLTFNSTEQVLPDGNHSWIVNNFSATGTNITTTSG
jgi:hypothetical protein